MGSYSARGGSGPKRKRFEARGSWPDAPAEGAEEGQAGGAGGDGKARDEPAYTVTRGEVHPAPGFVYVHAF